MHKKREHNGHMIFGGIKMCIFRPKKWAPALKKMFYDGGLYLE